MHRFLKSALAAVFLCALGAAALAGPSPTIQSSVAVCDPWSPQNCMQPNSLGQIAAGFSQRVTSTPTVANSSHTSGQCIGGFNAVTVAQANGQAGFVQDVRISSASGSTTGITVYLFDSNPSASTCTDAGTFTLDSADRAKLITSPFVITPAAPTGTTVSFGENSQMAMPFVAGGSTSSGVKTVYYGLVANGTFTPSANGLIVSIGVAF